MASLGERSRFDVQKTSKDDPEDRMGIEEAIEESGLTCELHVVQDGQELLDHLRRQQEYTDPCKAPQPGLIFRMPLMNECSKGTHLERREEISGWSTDQACSPQT